MEQMRARHKSHVEALRREADELEHEYEPHLTLVVDVLGKALAEAEEGEAHASEAAPAPEVPATSNADAPLKRAKTE